MYSSWSPGPTRARKWGFKLLVRYEHVFPYLYHPKSGEMQPVLPWDLVNPERPAERITMDGYLDSGCSKSLFDGRLALAIGLDPTRGRSIPYTSATGVTVRGILMQVRLEHPLLGFFDLEVGFSQVSLSRNLLGRDFLSLIQLGFRENRLELYISTVP